MGHELGSVDVAIGLGSHDLGVATAELYHSGLFPTLVFTGGNSPTTRAASCGRGGGALCVGAVGAGRLPQEHR
jgi:hypothetical protein